MSDKREDAMKDDINFLNPKRIGRDFELPYSVMINANSVRNGYTVTVGCQTFFIDSRERLLRLLDMYLADPQWLVERVVPVPPPLATADVNAVDCAVRNLDYRAVMMQEHDRPEPECCAGRSKR